MKTNFLWLSFMFIYFSCGTHQQATQVADTPTTTIVDQEVALPPQAQPADTSTIQTDPVAITGNWELIKADGTTAYWKKNPQLSIKLKEGTFALEAGCRSMTGSFIGQGTSLVFNNEVYTTKMNCKDDQDLSPIFKALLRVNNYRLTDSSLQLKQLDTVKLVFKRQLI